MSELRDLVRMLKKNKPSGSDYTGTVTRVDGNTAYVRLTGSDIMDTPCRISVDCKPGDSVRVRVNGGRAWVTGNDTAPPTNDRDNIRKLTQKADDNDKKVNRMQKTVDEAAGVAANTNQYFWHTEEGSDTGAHITEVPRKQFIADPENGGGNLLARSNGIAVRDGLTELASMTADDGIRIGKNDGFRAIINDDSIELIDDKGASGFRISLDGNETQRTIQNTYVVHSTQRPNITFSAPISSYLLSFKAVIGNNTYTATKTSAQLPINQAFNLGVNSSSGYIRVTRTGTNAFKAVYADTTARASSLQVSYVTTFDMAKMNFNGGNNILWQGGHYMVANQTVTLSESISEQLTGIVLVWSAYFEAAPQNYDWFYQFIPKDHVLRSEVGGVSSGMMTSAFQNGTAYLGMKYVLVSNNAIQGHEINGRSSMSVGGATLTNTHWVLRYVLGV